MKKFAALALLATAAIATPAMAQSASGTIQVTGTVPGKCTAITPITGTITLNDISTSTGTVLSSFSNQTGGLSRSFTVVCTSANASISVSSDALNNATDSSTGGGYTGRVHYTSTLSANKAGGGTATAVYTTADVLPAATTTALADRLAVGANNVTVAVSNGTTTNSGDVLKAGSYSSTIAITVAPL